MNGLILFIVCDITGLLAFRSILIFQNRFKEFINSLSLFYKHKEFAPVREMTIFIGTDIV